MNYNNQINEIRDKFYKNIRTYLFVLRLFGIYEPKLEGENVQINNFILYIWSLFWVIILTSLLILSMLNLVLSQNNTLPKFYIFIQLLTPCSLMLINLAKSKYSKKIWQMIPESTIMIDKPIQESNYRLIIIIDVVYVFYQGRAILIIKMS